MLRRRGPWCAAHPGWECGPCVLCGSPSPYYSHPATHNRAKLYQIELSVVSDSCICRACKTYKKEHFIRELQTNPVGPPPIKKNAIKCILPECTITRMYYNYFNWIVSMRRIKSGIMKYELRFGQGHNLRIVYHLLMKHYSSAG